MEWPAHLPIVGGGGVSLNIGNFFLGMVPDSPEMC